MADVLNTLQDINTMAQNYPERLIDRAEERYNEIISEAQKRACSDSKSEIILLAGPSSSGKTTTAKKIAVKLMEQGHMAYTVSLDDFYKNWEDAIIDENGNRDFETVHALDLECLSSTLKSLIYDGFAMIPQYDFDTGKRKEKLVELKLNEGDVVIVEGLHALNPIIYGDLPSDRLLKIYISVSTRIYDNGGNVLMTKRDLRLIRRTIRDYQFRNSSVENTFSMWQSVLDGENKYLAPYKYCADILIDSIHNYEPCVFKREALELFRTVPKDSIWYGETQRLSKSLEDFYSLSPSMVPDSSLMREFLGSKK